MVSQNEARMYLVKDIPPYISTVDAISKFPETATALGLKINEHGLEGIWKRLKITYIG
ncbi:nucleotidyltransferase family protein [Pseudalkalibacillus salsuginis]|uniref:nucleotidyltransferase family protein n=1 Tax=Pseudalkalibacillus salsuginis TaxID=2910972 RepID=UPI003899BEEC